MVDGLRQNLALSSGHRTRRVPRNGKRTCRATIRYLRSDDQSLARAANRMPKQPRAPPFTRHWVRDERSLLGIPLDGAEYPACACPCQRLARRVAAPGA